MKPVILIARPRSGTTALRGLVAQHFRMASLGEIFHEDKLDHPDYFFNYLLKEVKKTPTLALPSHSNRIALFKGYMEHVGASLSDKYPNKVWFFAGVNYNSLHSLNTYWQNFYDAPVMLNIIKWQGYHVVHLIRRNVVEAAISEVRAKTSGIWHIKTGEERPPEADNKTRIDPKGLLNQLRARMLEIELIERYMDGYDRCLTLEYEKLFEKSGNPVREEIDRLGNFLKLAKPIDLIVDFQKTRTTHLRDAIENYEEVASTLSGTEFAAMLGGE